jgi:hypothetical protein
MAYQQQYDNYQQPRQQQGQQQGQPQYYNQAPQGRQPAGYNQHEQYDEYGYDQGQYEQWDDGGYYDLQQGGGAGQQQQYQQPQGGYINTNGQMRQPAQTRRAPPQEQYDHEMYDEQAYQQPQGRDPRARPVGPNGGPPREAMQRGDSRGSGNSGNGRMPPPQQGQARLRPLGIPRRNL